MLQMFLLGMRSRFYYLRCEAMRRITVGRRSAHAASPSGHEEMTFTIARVIGNDLYPRHAEGQVLRNLDFSLEHEPAFLRCRKVFVLNRIFDPDVALAA